MFDWRKVSAKTSLLLFYLLSVAACNSPDNAQNNAPNHTQKSEYKTTIFAFGTLIDITLYDVDTNKANLAFAQLEKDFQHYHHDWSPWEDGQLNLLNQHFANGQLMVLTESLVENLAESPAENLAENLLPLIKQSISLSKQSMGLFNPTIGNLINLWQFHKYDEAGASPPSAERIQTLLNSNPQASDIQISGNTISSLNPAVQLSLGAFAKGYGIQLAMKTLHAMDIHNAVINAGGDLVASGRHGDRAWNIGIRHPRQETIIASLEIHGNESVFTSGDYERFYFHNNKRYHHILNPDTGYPTQGFSSVTVIHPNAGTADGAATALMVAGPERWFKIAKNMKLQSILLIDEQNNIIMTPKMSARIKLNKTDANHIIISEAL